MTIRLEVGEPSIPNDYGSVTAWQAVDEDDEYTKFGNLDTAIENVDYEYIQNTQSGGLLLRMVLYAEDDACSSEVEWKPVEN